MFMGGSGCSSTFVYHVQSPIATILSHSFNVFYLPDSLKISP